MKRLRLLNFLADIWRPTLLALGGVALIAGVLFIQIQSLLPGLSSNEADFLAISSSLEQLIKNPLFLFNKLGTLIVVRLDTFQEIAPRLISAFIGIAAAVAFYNVLRQWHTRRVASLSTALFVSSSWFLGVARLGTGESSYLLLIILLLGGIWLHKRINVTLATMLTVTSAVLLLYVPGMVWFVIPALVWQRRKLTAAISQLAIWWQALVTVFVLVGLLPLIWAFAQELSLVRIWLGVPVEIPSILQYLKNLVHVPMTVFFSSKTSVDYGLGSLPLIDAFTGMMVAFGAYAYAFRIKLDRTKLLLAAVVFGSMLIALNGTVPLALLLPFIYVLAAAGIALLLQKWFTVFPRNPLARSIAVTIMIVAVGAACFYHLNRYFVAWPNTPATKETFQHHS